MTTWILLRGLTREKRHWERFPEQWRETFPQDRVIPLELPGNGELSAMVSPVTLAGMAAHCHREASRMGITPPYNLLAMSMGAMVATAWAREHPDEVGACVLINTSFGSFSPRHHRLRPLAWLTLLRLLSTSSAEGREWLIFRLTSSLLEPPAHLIDDWVAIRQSRPVRFWNVLRQMIAAERFRAPALAPVPTLVLASAGDQLVNPRCSRDIARHWNCAIALHPTAGHDLPLDDGAWIAQAVHHWLARGGSRQGP
jgi:pimeloyl-ACP methyl ester carboxylesterase